MPMLFTNIKHQANKQVNFTTDLDLLCFINILCISLLYSALNTILDYIVSYFSKSIS
ncbi:hypothetical protein MiSe_73750 [Microseira wollei NIES-4236]|uniref:Transposase n=1 Tax=Microseira wollei NIES-4236 TaxID=2530354 RepID=A0AAV3XI04_9CYAN|nr:hypothetical protein MiSe_73750 [Microseira wollei NIES-4236]